jgi:hypothetical protein
MSDWGKGVRVSWGNAGDSEVAEVMDQLVDTAATTIEIEVLPLPRLPTPSADVQYLGFLSHSGFHNQRGALLNALLLGKLLNRTVRVCFTSDLK